MVLKYQDAFSVERGILDLKKRVNSFNDVIIGVKWNDDQWVPFLTLGTDSETVCLF